MNSKNKRGATARERQHIERIKAMACVVCDAPGPSDCHEIRQGHWFTSLPLCRDCHMGSKNGIHGQKAIWNVMKMDELGALGIVIERITA